MKDPVREYLDAMGLGELRDGEPERLPWARPEAPQGRGAAIAWTLAGVLSSQAQRDEMRELGHPRLQAAQVRLWADPESGTLLRLAPATRQALTILDVPADHVAPDPDLPGAFLLQIEAGVPCRLRGGGGDLVLGLDEDALVLQALRVATPFELSPAPPLDPPLRAWASLVGDDVWMGARLAAVPDDWSAVLAAGELGRLQPELDTPAGREAALERLLAGAGDPRVEEPRRWFASLAPDARALVIRRGEVLVDDLMSRLAETLEAPDDGGLLSSVATDREQLEGLLCLLGPSPEAGPLRVAVQRLDTDGRAITAGMRPGRLLDPELRRRATALSESWWLAA